MAVTYAVAAWLLIEVSATTFPILRLPEWTATFVTVLLMIGFPIALIFAWAFELTPEGIKLEKHVAREESITHVTGRKLDFAVIAMLVVALGVFAYDKFVLGPSRDAELVQTTTKVVTQQVTETVISEIPDKSIAVLAFADLSPEGDQEYFSDGISEEILNLLTKVPELRVTSRSSAFSFKGQNIDIPTMAAKLNVAHVLEGSVRQSGEQLRITAQLIEVSSDTYLWSATYNREMQSIFTIQDEIAEAVVGALKVTLLGNESAANETIPEAYTLYLKGRHLKNQGIGGNLKQAEAMLTQALALDSGFAPAWTDLGSVYLIDALADSTLQPNNVGMEMARESIQNALAINPRYGRAYAILAQIEMFYDWDFGAALMHQRQALALDPGDAGLLTIAGQMNIRLGRVDEAIEQYREAIALDPVTFLGYRHLGRALYYSGRLEEAADSLRHAIALNPSGPGNRYYLGRVLLSQGEASAALALMEQETALFYRFTGIAIVQHVLGDAVASNAALRQLLDRYEGSYQVAQVYAFRGEIDNAFDGLDVAYRNRDPSMTSLLVTPLLANLHDDPRWELWLDKMGLPY